MADRNVEQLNEAPEGEPSGRPGRPLEIQRLLNALHAARYWLGGAAILGVVLGYTVGKLGDWGTVYETSAILEWQPTEDEGGRQSNAGMQTLVASVKLSENIRELRRRLEIGEDLPQLGARLNAKAAPDSRLLMIQGEAQTPEEAVVLVNTMVDVFIDARSTNDGIRQQEALKRLLSDRDEAIKRVASAQAQFDAFRGENMVVDVSEETTAAIRQQAQLRSNADLAQAEALAEKARREAFDEVARHLPKTTTLSSREIVAEGQLLAETEARISSYKSRLSDDHPKIKELEAQAAALKEGIKHSSAPTTERSVGINPQWDAARVAGTAAATSERAALTRQESFQALALTNQNRLERLAAMSGQDRVYRATLAAAEDRLEAIETSIAAVGDAARAPSTGLEMVSKPTPPVFAESSNKSVVAAAIAMLVFLSALVFVIIRELRGLKAHTASEVAFWTQVPVVASSLWPAKPEALDDVVRDLCASWQERTGKLLVVPLGESETQSAAALAREMLATTVQEDNDFAPSLDDASSLVSLWERKTDGAAFRRTVREANWVLVTIRSGAHSIPRLSSLPTQLGRIDGVGIVVVGLDPNLEGCADRAGPVDDFWSLKPQIA
jgi:uncharacterized protein involved in exopolysaccharide biosynthesis